MISINVFSHSTFQTCALTRDCLAVSRKHMLSIPHHSQPNPQQIPTIGQTRTTTFWAHGTTNGEVILTYVSFVPTRPRPNCVLTVVISNDPPGGGNEGNKMGRKQSRRCSGETLRCSLKPRHPEDFAIIHCYALSLNSIVVLS